jgi:hypothetical protein
VLSSHAPIQSMPLAPPSVTQHSALPTSPYVEQIFKQDQPNCCKPWAWTMLSRIGHFDRVPRHVEMCG